jgi:phosphonoacetate hydrolase
VAAITAKDKLRKMVGRGLRGICFSSERARETTLEENGIDEVERLVGRPTPDMYSPDLSLFVLDAGIRLLESQRADVLYLSLSDMV